MREPTWRSGGQPEMLHVWIGCTRFVIVGDSFIARHHQYQYLESPR